MKQTTDISFTGQNQDTVAGLYDLPAREYSIQGRWPSPDPAGLAAVDPSNPQPWNRYAYVLNNPLSFIDPLGMTCFGTDDEGNDKVLLYDTEADCTGGGGTWITVDTTVQVNANDSGDASSTTSVDFGGDSFSLFSGNFSWGGGPVGGSSSTQGSQTPTFKQQYNQCVQGAGTTLKVADTLGVWGLGSLAVTAGSSAFTSTMQWIHGTSATNIASTVAQQAPNTAADAGTLANMGEHELFLEGTWATVGKISLWVTAGATAVSGGVRGYCAAKAAF